MNRDMRRKEDQWREVDKFAICCTPCRCNVKTDDGYHCNAEGGICIFLKKPVNNPDKVFTDFKDVYVEEEG